MIIEPPKEDTPQEKEGFYQAYSIYAWKFRLWMIAYGVGIPLLTLNNPELRSAVKHSEYGLYWIYAALIGTALQIILTWIYKSAMWYSYDSKPSSTEQTGWLQRAVTRTSDEYWIEVTIDLVCFILFTAVTLGLLNIALGM